MQRQQSQQLQLKYTLLHYQRGRWYPYLLQMKTYVHSRLVLIDCLDAPLSLHGRKYLRIMVHITGDTTRCLMQVLVPQRLQL